MPSAEESLSHIDATLFDRPCGSRFAGAGTSIHAPRFLMLYGSLRERSHRKLLTLEAARLLRSMGGEVCIYDPAGLPLPDGAPDRHPKVQELRDAATWAEGMVWTSPERHGAMTGIMKAQIDWFPLSVGAVRPTQGKTLAVMEVSGGSQSYNAVNQMSLLAAHSTRSSIRPIARWLKRLAFLTPGSQTSFWWQTFRHRSFSASGRPWRSSIATQRPSQAHSKQIGRVCCAEQKNFGRKSDL